MKFLCSFMKKVSEKIFEFVSACHVCSLVMCCGGEGIRRIRIRIYDYELYYSLTAIYGT